MPFCVVAFPLETWRRYVPGGNVGIDTASIDYGQSRAFESHRVLYERDIPAFENLTMLERLPAVGAFIVALPMKI